jgi:PEP-CTERM motif
MRKFVYINLLVAVFAVMVLPAKANPMLSLSSPANLTTLTVGQEFEVDVTLSGLSTGSDFIFQLDSQEIFSSSLLAVVPNSADSSGLTPGGIFFDPSQVANFNAASSLNAGSAVGDFSNSSPNSSFAINANGVFYSFELEAKGTGSGTIQFASTAGANQYAANDTGFNLSPIPTGSSLAFDIGPAITGSAVPEPSSLGLIAMFGPAVALAGWMRRKIA